MDDGNYYGDSMKLFTPFASTVPLALLDTRIPLSSPDSPFTRVWHLLLFHRLAFTNVEVFGVAPYEHRQLVDTLQSSGARPGALAHCAPFWLQTVHTQFERRDGDGDGWTLTRVHWLFSLVTGDRPIVPAPLDILNENDEGDITRAERSTNVLLAYVRLSPSMPIDKLFRHV